MTIILYPQHHLSRQSDTGIRSFAVEHHEQSSIGVIPLGSWNSSRRITTLLYGQSSETIWIWSRRCWRFAGIWSFTKETKVWREAQLVRENQAWNGENRRASWILWNIGMCKRKWQIFSIKNFFKLNILFILGPKSTFRPGWHHMRTFPRPILDILWRDADREGCD